MERISGNSGTDQKYLVVAKNGNVALGLYLSAGRDFNRQGEQFTVKGRLRAAAAPGCEATAQEINDAFKGLPFEKFAEDGYHGRASCTVGIFTNQTERVAFPDALDDVEIGPRVFEWLTTFISADLLTVTVDKLHEAIKGEFVQVNAGKEASTKFVMRIAEHDESLRPAVESVMENLKSDLIEAQAVYDEAAKKARKCAEEASAALVKKHQKKNPDFSFVRKEDQDHVFGLESLFDYGFAESDDNTIYDA